MNKGVYIVDLEGKLYNVSDWNKGSDATGVALITDKVSIIIAKDEWCSRDSDMKSTWSEPDSLVPGLIRLVSLRDASNNFDGSSNTDAIINSSNNGTNAAKYCRAYSSGCKGVGQWYLPAAGEYTEIVNNYKIINAALRAINGVPLYKNKWAWTSTQHSFDCVWGFHWPDGFFGAFNKFGCNGVRPICKI